MALNPEQFGLDVAAAPWAGVRQMGVSAMGPMGVVRPIIAAMEQAKEQQESVFLGQRIDVRKAPSPIGKGVNIFPDASPGAGRGQ